ncbi:Txe/YoeB family addiction module toxin [Bordetella genomosp. 5]|uniref:Txe/YoeB family addiction module toxin n=1 Tax=Bordetella genomosp. 5 TaxID=1395608 RepID=UPI00201601AE|nr:Txe/YoeB family addiction module toxin [Bordetella genomosp. 5]
MNQQRKKARNKAAASDDVMVAWTSQAWEDYCHWYAHDVQVVRAINALIREISRDPLRGTGKPEPLRGDLTGFWSRRINKTDRLVYTVQDGRIIVLQCRYHYQAP